MLTHTQVRKPAAPSGYIEPDFFERNKEAAPFSWVSFSDEKKTVLPLPQNNKG
ncbi:hypothetical protein [Iodobacter ciconiae]|uniref:hypothetical protein n=1 Tax=Iodobacter ciconiae TaxID=2496266 RepID=UPI0013DE83F5|nr:hypothetical protein [Iodobacter ciconiae]